MTSGGSTFAAPALVLVLVLLHCAGGIPIRKPVYATDRVLVRWKPGAASLKSETSLSLKRLRAVGSQGVALYKVSENSTVETTLKQLNSSPDVYRAEPDYLVFPTDSKGSGVQPVVPTDPLFPDQWHLTKISADKAWSFDRGSIQVRVCVTDSGARIDHPDLMPSIYKGFNLVPEDQVTPGPAPTPNDTWYYNYNDTLGHGTHTAGTIGAVGNNGIGVAGVAWAVELVICKFMWDPKPGVGAFGFVSDAITCLQLCRNEGALISSNSWGGIPDSSQIMYDEIKGAGDQGQLFVCAAGNVGVNMDVTPQYPEAYNLDNIITVGSVSTTDNRSDFSNYGKKTVHMFAPGEDIISTTYDKSYGPMWGTSAAAPIVAGSAALIQATAKSYGVTLPYQRIKYHLLQGVDRNPRLANLSIAGGRLNVFKALQSVLREVDPVADYVICGTSYTTAPDCGTWTKKSRSAWRRAASDLFGAGAKVTVRCQFVRGTPGKKYAKVRIMLTAKVAGVSLSSARALADKVGQAIKTGAFRQMVAKFGGGISRPRTGDGYCVVGAPRIPEQRCPPSKPAIRSRLK